MNFGKQPNILSYFAFQVIVSCFKNAYMFVTEIIFAVKS